MALASAAFAAPHAPPSPHVIPRMPESMYATRRRARVVQARLEGGDAGAEERAIRVLPVPYLGFMVMTQEHVDTTGCRRGAPCATCEWDLLTSGSASLLHRVIAEDNATPERFARMWGEVTMGDAARAQLMDAFYGASAHGTPDHEREKCVDCIQWWARRGFRAYLSRHYTPRSLTRDLQPVSARTRTRGVKRARAR